MVKAQETIAKYQQKEKDVIFQTQQVSSAIVEENIELTRKMKRQQSD